MGGRGGQGLGLAEMKAKAEAAVRGEFPGSLEMRRMAQELDPRVSGLELALGTSYREALLYQQMGNLTEGKNCWPHSPCA